MDNNHDSNRVQPNNNQTTNQSRHFKIGNIGKDFSPEDSPIMSDQKQISSVDAEEIENGSQNNNNLNTPNNVDSQRKFEISKVEGNFSPKGSPIMSDNTIINKQKKKKLNIAIIITLIGIVLTVCVSGVLNPEIRKWLGLEQPSPTQEAPNKNKQ